MGLSENVAERKIRPSENVGLSEKSGLSENLAE